MQTNRLHCDTMKWVRQADDLFVCFGAKQNKSLSSRSRRDRKWTRERWSERSWKKGTQWRSWRGWRRRAVEEQWGKTSQDESAFLVALWKFREGCTLALVYRCTGNAVSQNHPSCTWVNPSPFCSFVRLFFFSHSLGCISFGHNVMWNTPAETTRWITGQDRIVSRSWCNGGREGVLSHDKPFKSYLHIMFTN